MASRHFRFFSIIPEGGGWPQTGLCPREELPPPGVTHVDFADPQRCFASMLSVRASGGRAGGQAGWRRG